MSTRQQVVLALLAGVVAALLVAVVLVEWLAPPAARADEVVRYQHIEADVVVPARTWRVVNEVGSVRGRAGYYSWQAAIDSPSRGRCNVRFVRMPASDGTGDQTFLHPRGLWWITHQHTVGGFSSAMQVRLWCSERATVRWRILKGIA